MIKQELFRYVILPGKPLPGFKHQELHDQAYSFWKAFWSKVYSDAGSPESFHPEDFIRQNYIPVILYDERIVAMHLYTIFNIRSRAAREHRYFNFFPEEIFSYLSDKSVNSVLSVEYLTVAEGWRKHDLGISLSRVLVECCRNLAQQLPIQALLAPARTDNKVSDIARDFGFETFRSGLIKRNFKVDLVVGFPRELHPCLEAEAMDLAQKLWNSRSDFTQQDAESLSEAA